MDKSMSQEPELEDHEIELVDEESLNYPVSREVGRRYYPRWYFHDPEVPMEEQSSGIAGEVRRPGVLHDPLIGRIIIKDMSLGGIGFIAPRRFHLPKKVVVMVGNTYPLVCEVLHARPLSRALVFYGARWYRMDKHVLMMAISRYARLCRLVS